MLFLDYAVDTASQTTHDIAKGSWVINLSIKEKRAYTRMRDIERAWRRCFRYKDIYRIKKCEHECTLLILPRKMASMVIFP
jgi:hypothetical protein